MLNHEREKETVELWPARRVQVDHLIGGQHAGHEHRVIHAGHHVTARVGGWHELLVLAQPALRERDLVVLGHHDALAQDAHRRTRAMRGRPPGHLDGLGMVADHPRHEVHVGRGIGSATAVGLGLRGGLQGRLLDGGGGARCGGDGHQKWRFQALDPFWRDVADRA